MPQSASGFSSVLSSWILNKTSFVLLTCMDVTQHSISLSSVLTELLMVTSGGGKGVLPYDPRILTCDISGLPSVFIGTVLFMFATVCVAPQIGGCRAACVVVKKVTACVCARWPETSAQLWAERQGGVLLSL